MYVQGPPGGDVVASCFVLSMGCYISCFFWQIGRIYDDETKVKSVKHFQPGFYGIVNWECGPVQGDEDAFWWCLFLTQLSVH